MLKAYVNYPNPRLTIQTFQNHVFLESRGSVTARQVSDARGEMRRGKRRLG
jgi:hypothetical protein